MSWYIRGSSTVPSPDSSTSRPWSSAGRRPSRSTVKRTGTPAAGGVTTRLRSRARKRNVIEPPAVPRTALVVRGPVAGERPLIQRQLRGRIGAPDPAALADVGLPRPQRLPVRGLGEPARFNADGFLVDAQELLDRSLALLVVALAEVVKTDSTDAIDEVKGGPILVRQRSPDGEVVVDDDGVVDAQPTGRLPHVVEVMLEPELGAVHADDDEPAVAISLSPRSDVRQCAQPVDA